MSSGPLLNTSSASRGGSSSGGRKKRERAKSHHHHPRHSHRHDHDHDQQHDAGFPDHDSSDGRAADHYPLKDTDHHHHHHHQQQHYQQQQPPQHNNNSHHRRKSSSPRLASTQISGNDIIDRPGREKSENENERGNKNEDEDDGGGGGTVELVRKIGQGSCGAVYLGRHPQTHRDYAVKLIPKDASDQRTARLLQRVRLEGDLLLALDHPHIVRGYGVMETDSHAFLFMEHAQGGDLLEYLNREGALTETRARLMFRQVVRAVRHLHQRGWVHRDIKPENIFIAFEDDDGEEGRESLARSARHQHDNDDVDTSSSSSSPSSRRTSKPNNKRSDESLLSSPSSSASRASSSPRRRRKVRLVLGDMGFARQWAPTKRMQECVGTFPYAAPEVINREKYIGPEVDVWSLGVVLLAMLTAQMPFGAPTEEMSRQLAAAGQFCVPPDISDAALDLLASILQPNAAARITLDDLWHHPWMRVMTSGSSGGGNGVDLRGSTTRFAKPKSEEVGDETAEKKTKTTQKAKKKEEEERRKAEKKKKNKERETETEEEAVEKAVESPASGDDSPTKQKKRSRVHRAASLLFRRTTNAMTGAGNKKRGRSTSAMASTNSSIISLSNDRVRTLATN